MGYEARTRWVRAQTVTTGAKTAQMSCGTFSLGPGTKQLEKSL